MVNLYELLELAPSASEPEIRQALKARTNLHPHVIHAVYEWLLTPAIRLHYDNELQKHNPEFFIPSVHELIDNIPNHHQVSDDAPSTDYLDLVDEIIKDNKENDVVQNDTIDTQEAQETYADNGIAINMDVDAPIFTEEAMSSLAYEQAQLARTIALEMNTTLDTNTLNLDELLATANEQTQDANEPTPQPLPTYTLWHPVLTSLLALICPPVGAWLHAYNWQILGDTKQAKDNKIMAVVMFIIVVAMILVKLTTGISTHPAIILILSFSWYVSMGKKQVDTVRLLPRPHREKNWLKPAFYTLCTYMALATITYLSMVVLETMGLLHDSIMVSY